MKFKFEIRKEREIQKKVFYIRHWFLSVISCFIAFWTDGFWTNWSLSARILLCPFLYTGDFYGLLCYERDHISSLWIQSLYKTMIFCEIRISSRLIIFKKTIMKISCLTNVVMSQSIIGFYFYKFRINWRKEIYSCSRFEEIISAN